MSLYLEKELTLGQIFVFLVLKETYGAQDALPGLLQQRPAATRYRTIRSSIGRLGFRIPFLKYVFFT